MGLNEDAAGQDGQGFWARLKSAPVLAVVMVIVTVIGLVTAAVSYGHERQLAGRNGQAAWAASLIPFAVDGMVLAASIVLLWAGLVGIRGWRRLWRPRLWLAVGIAATIAANFFSDLLFWWLGPAVSASCGVALVIISDIAFWLLGEQRKMTAPETEPASPSQPEFGQPEPPPLTLSDAVKAAHAHGLSGNKIAARFDLTRYRVSQILGADERPAELAADLAELNGSGPS